MTEYYKNCAFPKPVDKKKKKMMNGYKNKSKRFCAYCGEPYAERHEIFAGPLRKISMENGFQVDVCRRHHKELQDNITTWAQAENKLLKAECERRYLDQLMENGFTEEEALEEWMSPDFIGKNYIEELMPC